MFNAKAIVPKETPATMMESAVFGGAYCSLPMTTDEEKKLVFNAVNRATKKLREAVNITIHMTGLYIEPVEISERDESGDYVEDGRTSIAPRIIIFAEDGTTYGCCSLGAYNSIKRIVSMFGLPDTWKKPVDIVPTLVTNGKNQVLTINLA
ncbi:TPA: hypothetical protein IAC10_04285 [Candidatus Scatousia excrementigallinarum]|uniref:Uncharacterized protein n=1 Tax=Candidatus Scatousia excrementigallinarum TaxID=2840935 RepID=A0A9D1EYL7_9BACT|nr:hypothetical protein [Candidatus Scatousia excrementigallinarum]